MWDRVKSKLECGSIILSHSGTQHTADGLELLINNIKKEGYEIVTVSNLIYNDDYWVDARGIQHKK